MLDFRVPVALTIRRFLLLNMVQRDRWHKKPDNQRRLFANCLHRGGACRGNEGRSSAGRQSRRDLRGIVRRGEPQGPSGHASASASALGAGLRDALVGYRICPVRAAGNHCNGCPVARWHVRFQCHVAGGERHGSRRGRRASPNLGDAGQPVPPVVPYRAIREVGRDDARELQPLWEGQADVDQRRSGARAWSRARQSRGDRRVRLGACHDLQGFATASARH
mmetsp:Transcript_88187/g.254499  ORF Transcript_88187/g.254499 Transcript_88187/m.254499 type:complete len:222 (-) Transcript_88187:1519-2184(-)